MVPLTDDQIFAAPLRALDLDNILQVARTHRNVTIAKLFGDAHAASDGAHISPMTVGARISRSIDAVAERDGVDRETLMRDFYEERVRNGVAGKNQFTGGAEGPKKLRAAEKPDVEKDGAGGGKRVTPEKGQPMSTAKGGAEPIATPEVAGGGRVPRPKRKRPEYAEDDRTDSDATEDDDVSPVPRAHWRKLKRTKRVPTQQSTKQRRNSKAPSPVTGSPAQDKDKVAAASALLSLATAGDKRKRDANDEASKDDSQRADAGPKLAKARQAPYVPYRPNFVIRRAASASQDHSFVGSGGDSDPSSSGSSDLGERSPMPPSPTGSGDRTPSASSTSSDEADEGSIEQQLADAEAHNLFAADAAIDDMFVMELATRHTLVRIVKSANRGADKRDRWDEDLVRRRVVKAVSRTAVMKQRSYAEERAALIRARAGEGIEADGMFRR